MMKRGIQACYVHGSDPHMSEYLPVRWQTREFMSGFTGSYGWLAITPDRAALWTDSRYFLQAEEQLKGTGIDMMKARLPETPDVVSWLISNLPANSQVGVNSECLPHSLYENMLDRFSRNQIGLIDTGDLLDHIWEDRPSLPASEIFEHEFEYAGLSRADKIQGIRKELEKAGSDMHILTALDDIAWTFNLRGSDIEYNPVFLSYAVIDHERAVLFVDQDKLSENLRSKLENDGVVLLEYTAVFGFLKETNPLSRVYVDQDKTNQAIISMIPPSCKIIKGVSIPCLLKALKNPIEIANIRNAMKKDGVALLEFLYWFEKTIGNERITEFDVAVALNKFRSKQKGFKGDSFAPLVGYKEHGAMVHLSVDEKNALEIKKDGILLFDSGGHYLDGTTDITRTIALGEPTQQQKTDYTLVLKGMIALTEAVFPENTKGCHLDILARQFLWAQGLNYGHGTGHGVGFFLNVHEGPVSIRMDLNEQTIRKVWFCRMNRRFIAKESMVFVPKT